MDATPITNGKTGTAGDRLATSGRALFDQRSASALGMKWAALHEAAGAVAGIAGVVFAPLPAEVRDFPAVMCDAGGWRHELVEQGIEDLAAIMEPGLTALLSAHARGADARAAARALWHEFVIARDAMLAFAPHDDAGTADVA
jgi:hypothetical protein